MNQQLQGIAITRGVAMGRAVKLGSERVEVTHYLVAPHQIPHEIERLQAGLQKAVQELQHIQADVQPGADAASAELMGLLDVHLMLLQDAALLDAVTRLIEQRHLNAEWALAQHLEDLVEAFDAMDDDYLRERKADLEQLISRVQRFVQQQRSQQPQAQEPDQTAPASRTGDTALSLEGPLIVVAHDLSPADMLQFKQDAFAGFVTEVGGATSHTAIVARGMDIPAVVGARGAVHRIEHDDWLVVDAEKGCVIINPDEELLAYYRQRMEQERQHRQRQQRLLNIPAITADGVGISLMANIETPADCAAALAAGAVGVGLFRSEFLYMGRGGELPGEEEQYQVYRQALQAMKGLPVTIRTVDIGADKPLAQWRESGEQHSALGQRAIRWCLAEPEMFRVQLRALLRAACHGPLQVLIPLLAQQWEIERTFAEIERARSELLEAGQQYGSIQVGAMIEVPAAALMIDQFLDYFDFVSIGTNDLIQYTLAIDRADESVADWFDDLHPAVLRLINMVIERCRQRRKKVSICGEMAGDPAMTALLLGMGLRCFSSNPSQILAVKEQVLQTSIASLQEWTGNVLASYEPRKLLASAPVQAALPQAHVPHV